MPRRVRIKSIFTGDTWSGEVDLPLDDQEALNRVSRLFSRVDDEDAERLEEIGYRLPSISVGDRVDLDGQRYWADTVGWTVTWSDLPAWARAIPHLRGCQRG